MTVKVSLDINADPAVTVNPQTTHVNNGNATVVWVPAANQPAFTFVGVSISPPGHFAAPVITPPGGPVQMSVTENPPYEPGVDFYYQITVKYNGNEYQSKPALVPAAASADAEARHLPPARTATFRPGDPVIHNN